MDEAERDPDFVSYRARLLAALEARDETELLKLVDPRIRTTFGEGGGKEAFARKLSSPEGHAWEELLAAVRLGGSFRGESFWAPYVYSAWPENFDAFTHVAATRAAVPLRSEPRSDGHVLRSLDWSIVEVIGDDAKGWRHVRTADGGTGWVAAADVRSPVAYRAGFNRSGGSWKMTAFVAGD